MINKKLINIKNMLRIIISVMVIFSMAKSCAKALTYEDIKDYVNQTADYFSSNSNYQTIKSLINAMNTTQQNNVDTMASGYQNVAIYIRKQSGRTYGYIKVFHGNSLVISTQNVTYTGNYRMMFYDSGWGNPSSATNEYNSSIDSGSSYDRTAGYENNLLGMCYLGQTPTSRYRLPSNICWKSRTCPISKHLLW